MPSPTSAASTKTDSTAAVAFSQARPKAASAGTRIRAQNATRLIRSAPPKRTYSERTVAGGGSGSGTGIGLIVTERIDRNRDGPAPRKGRDAEPPARRDVAQEVDAQVDAREADQPRQEDPRHEQRRAAGEARAQAQRQRRGDPRVEHRVGRVPARERVAADRDELPGRARPRDRVLDQGDGQVDDRAR